jgi:hypothetical protein
MNQFESWLFGEIYKRVQAEDSKELAESKLLIEAYKVEINRLRKGWWLCKHIYGIEDSNDELSHKVCYNCLLPTHYSVTCSNWRNCCNENYSSATLKCVERCDKDFKQCAIENCIRRVCPKCLTCYDHRPR